MGMNRPTHQSSAQKTRAFLFGEAEPLELITAVDVAYKGIRSSILSGEFEPGMQLKLQNLGNRYSISLIPVREALRLLEAEGLVESVRNKGARVAPISMADALDVYRLRLILETEALKMAFEHLDEELLKRLQNYQRSMRETFSKNRDEYLALHQQLHFGIYNRCGSKWTLKLLWLLWSHSERWRRLSVAKIDLNAPTEDHSEIISALRARDLDAACVALEHHIQVSVRSLESTLPTPSDDHAPTPKAVPGATPARTRRPRLKERV
jgi:GntR family transcriptional regulator, carbon starvation induced regulator